VRGQPTTFWGKLEREDGRVVAWHPLLAHSADVAACAEALLQRTILGRRFAVLAGRDALCETDIDRLSALAALHDIGKFNLGFQRKKDLDARDVAGHVSEALDLLGSDYEVADRLRAALPSDAMGQWFREEEGAGCLLVAAIGHHGRPMACGAKRPEERLWERTSTLDPLSGVESLTSSVQRWFPGAFDEAGRRLPAPAPLQHAFAGLVMLADWLGSDRSADRFPFAESLEDRMPFARGRAAGLVAALGLDVTAHRRSLGAHLPGFDRVSHYPPRAAQAKTLSLPRDVQGGLTVLESETGSGKTEAALGRFLQLFHGGLVDGLIFALPTRSAATQLHARVVEAVRRAFPEEACRPAVVLAVPGYLQVDDVHGQRLAGFEVLWNDARREPTRNVGWAAEQPKRYLAGTIAVGTIDQVLLSSLRVGHAHLRATALLRHLLVVDEVHASDAYMNRILEEVLGFHLSAGGHALLMSATLGTAVRERLQRATTARLSHGPPTGCSLAEAIATPYPVIHHVPRGEAGMTVLVDAPGLPKTVHVAVERLADHPDAVVARALEAARRGARVLILRNTVTDALTTQVALERARVVSDQALLFSVGDALTLHHARFAREDRIRLDTVIEDRFGHPERVGGVVAVTTQTVQQSLDLDADLLFTDLAPMDVLLQRVGRLHRHRQRDGVRPAGFDRARAVVLIGDEPLEVHLRRGGEARGPHGVGSVYEDLLILAATEESLTAGGELQIPGQNRERVERTTHPEALRALADRLGGPWVEHLRRCAGRHLAHRGIAGLNIVERDVAFGEYTFQTTSEEERIATRLGEGDRRAVFTSPSPGPFGALVRELTLPAWTLRSAPRDLLADPDLVPGDVRVESGEFGPCVRFSFATVAFEYDRLGLRTTRALAQTTIEEAVDA